MPSAQPSILREVFATWRFRIATALSLLFFGLSVYSDASGQFDLPKLPGLWAMTLGQVPLWGWISFLQFTLTLGILRHLRKLPRSAVPKLSEETTKAIAELQRRLDDLEAARPRTAERLEEVERAIKFGLAPIVKERDARIAREQIQMVQALLRPTPAVLSNGEQTSTQNSTRAWSLNQMRKKIWLSEPDLARINKRTAEIQADPVYCTLQPGEEEIWGHGASKRAWHLEDAELKLIIEILQERARA